MINIIPVTKKPYNLEPNTIYVENIENDSMFKKYNRGIEQALKEYPDEQFFCLRHDDTEFRQPLDVIEYKLRRTFSDKKVGMAGVIGCISLYPECIWWSNRSVNGIGAIIQGFTEYLKDNNNNNVLDNNGKPICRHAEKFMSGDLIATEFMQCDYAATVDGCCMYFPRWILEEGLRFDENLQDYHFYDADICCQVLSKGYKVAITDTVIYHNSVGEMPKNFGQLTKVFHDKWDKKIDGWPISRLTKFKDVKNENH